MSKGKKSLLVMLGLVLGLFIIIGISYAYFLITKTQTSTNIVNTKCFTMSFTDADNINLNGAYPLTDSDGKKLTPYTFTINNTCDTNANYAINLETLSASTLDISHVKTEINSGDAKLLNSLTSATTTIDGALDSRTLTTGFLAANQSVSYTLRLWMDADTSLNDGSNKTYQSKVVVISTADFNNKYADTTGANQPVLYQGLIPVKYDASGNTVVADTTSEWYNYESHNWANAVLVNCADSTIKAKYFDSGMNLKSSVVGTTISASEILQYYVWIPRYKYLLWNAENGSSDPHAISIVFERTMDTKSSGSTNGTWLTHPAFTFGTTELPGIWVGKFESSGTTSALTIKPDVTSLRNITLGDMFNASRNIENSYANNYGVNATEIDTHMMKNMEWGATAYLSSSIYGRYNSDATTCISSGCEVWKNPNSNYTTGCAGATVSASSSTTCNVWTSTLGVNASTTGNLYGIYDMSGGAWEYVMGNMVDASGNYYPSSSGLSKPDTKYFDSYSYSASNYTDHARGHLGDATKETLKTFGSESGGWYSDTAHLPSDSTSWFSRGGGYSDGADAGAFFFGRGTGVDGANVSFHSVLTAQ
jgi:hypothetical protein